jgi:hypothetical protein
VLKGGATRTVPVVDGVVITPSAGVTTIRVRGVSGKVTALRENGR